MIMMGLTVCTAKKSKKTTKNTVKIVVLSSKNKRLSKSNQTFAMQAMPKGRGH